MEFEFENIIYEKHPQDSGGMRDQYIPDELKPGERESEKNESTEKTTAFSEKQSDSAGLDPHAILRMQVQGDAVIAQRVLQGYLDTNYAASEDDAREKVAGILLKKYPMLPQFTKRLTTEKIGSVI